MSEKPGQKPNDKGSHDRSKSDRDRVTGNESFEKSDRLTVFDTFKPPPRPKPGSRKND